MLTDFSSMLIGQICEGNQLLHMNHKEGGNLATQYFSYFITNL